MMGTIFYEDPLRLIQILWIVYCWNKTPFLKDNLLKIKVPWI